jgi:hypothetical protein
MCLSKHENCIGRAVGWHLITSTASLLPLFKRVVTGTLQLQQKEKGEIYNS